MSLVDDCMKALGEDAVILSQEETAAIFSNFIRKFPFTRWGRINWPQIEQYFTVDSVSEILPTLASKGRRMHEAVFILWDEVTLPAIKSHVDTALSHIEEITMVSFDTWIFCPTEEYVIEFYHEGNTTVGFSNKDGQLVT